MKRLESEHLNVFAALKSHCLLYMEKKARKVRAFHLSLSLSLSYALSLPPSHHFPTDPPSPSPIPQSFVDEQETLEDALGALVRPWMQTAFSGILNIHSLLWSWDQMMVQVTFHFSSVQILSEHSERMYSLSPIPPITPSRLSPLPLSHQITNKNARAHARTHTQARLPLPPSPSLHISSMFRPPNITYKHITLS